MFSGFDDAAAAAMFADLMHGNIPAGFAEGGGGGGGDGGGGGGARGRSAGTGTGFRGRSYDSDDSSTDSDYYDKGDVRNHLCVCGVRNLGAAHPPVLTFTAHEDGGVLLPCTRMRLLCVYVFMGSRHQYPSTVSLPLCASPPDAFLCAQHLPRSYIATQSCSPVPPASQSPSPSAHDRMSSTMVYKCTPHLFSHSHTRVSSSPIYLCITPVFPTTQ